jgi:BirA family transcriptional regulator, biotin operon repressor / biotin---[acetyl-CoA-carboxylase] ligase
LSTDRPHWPEGYDLVTHDQIDSTMAEAARIAPTIARPTWIRAGVQTAGRGRRGNVWLHPPGNLAATLVYKPWASPAEAAKRSFLAANALYQALAIVAPGARLSLKWPNDVLLNGGKVAGIMLESRGTGAMVDWLAIGIGVNLLAAPDRAAVTGSADPVSLADETGVTITPEEFLPYLANAFAVQESKLAAFGFPRIREEWLEHAARLGEPIIARTTSREFVGIFETVDQDGNLMLATSDGVELIPAADVYF